MKIIKIIFKIFLIIIILFMIQRFVRLYSEGKFDSAIKKEEIVYINSIDYKEYMKNMNNQNNNSNQNEKTNEESNSSFQLNLKQPTDDYYNQFNFDNVILLYEGKQDANAIKYLLNRILKNADDSLYKKPNIVFENINGISQNSITPEKLNEYKKVLEQAEKNIIDGEYEVSFGYNKLKSIVDTVKIRRNK